MSLGQCYSLMMTWHQHVMTNLVVYGQHVEGCVSLVGSVAHDVGNEFDEVQNEVLLSVLTCPVNDRAAGEDSRNLTLGVVHSLNQF